MKISSSKIEQEAKLSDCVWWTLTSNLAKATDTNKLAIPHLWPILATVVPSYMQTNYETRTYYETTNAECPQQLTQSKH